MNKSGGISKKNLKVDQSTELFVEEHPIHSKSSFFQKNIFLSKRLFFIIPAFFFLLALASCVYVLNNTKRHHLQAPVTTTSPTLTPTLPGIVQGEIQWNKNIQQIHPVNPLDRLNDMTYEYDTHLPQSKSIIRKVEHLQYYHVGNWISGLYNGGQVIDVVFSATEPSYASGTVPVPTTQSAILRFTVYNKTLVYFPNSSTLTNIGLKLPSSLRQDSRHLPDLLFSYPTTMVNASGSDEDIPFPISFQGKTKNFLFVNYGGQDDHWDPQQFMQYTYFSSFFHGQKLFVKKQSSVIPWRSIETNQYLVQDVDHSITPIDDMEMSSRIPSYQDQHPKLQWIGSSPLNDGLYYGTDYVYQKNFQTMKCKFFTTAALSGNTTFVPTDLSAVMQYQGNSYYTPSHADTFYHSLYTYMVLNTSIANGNLVKVSYTDFLKTDPMLVQKDIFGQYRLYYRSQGSSC